MRDRIVQPSVPWPELLAFANRELLAPTLWVRLRDKQLTDALPAEIAAVLKRSHALNVVRNARSRAELLQAVRAINRVGVEPVVLKGAVDLVASRYGDSGARILRDIDFFVPRERLADCIASLETVGYVEAPREATKFQTYAADLTRPGNLMSIDLQYFISGQRDLLGPAAAMASSVLFEIDGLRLRTLSPTHQIVHNLLHSEVQDRGGDAGLVWLRQLLDLAALRHLHEAHLDWPAIERHFAAHGFPKLVRRRLYMAESLLGQAMPPGLPANRDARRHVERCLLQFRWNWLRRTMQLWAVLASAFDARLMDVMYDSGLGRGRTLLTRGRHGLRLVGRHAGDLNGILKKRLTKFE